MSIYKIAEVYLEVKGQVNAHYWNKFKIKDVSVRADCLIEIFSKPNKTVYELEEYILYKNMTKCYRNCGEVMATNDDWSIVQVMPPSNIENIYSFILQGFYAHAVKRHMIQVHSSMIEFKNKGITFIGPSGIGKTTMAELWARYNDAKIINGDMNYIQETPEAFLGWGTPWHGSSPYCENTSVPLKAMIVLKQSPENSIRELTGFEKVTAVSNNVFYPRWLENGMELCLETLDHLLSRIPVYELSCRPDEEAVKLTEETIFDSSSVSD